jgi:IclR family transcriptional regulator, KDG regulon repressor
MTRGSAGVNGHSAARGVERTLQILGLFSEAKPEWKVQEISSELDVPLASAYRIVRILERSGYLERPRPGPSLQLGLAVLRLGSVVLSGLDMREIARPIMRDLASSLGETALLMVPFSDGAVCIENVEGTYPIRPRSIAVGEQMSFNAGALPLAILAFLPEEDRDRILRSPLPRIAEETLVKPDQIRDRCAHIAETGISYSSGEIVLGTAAVASPIFGADGAVAGAVGVTGLVERIVDFDESIRAAACEITRRFGGDPTRIPEGQAPHRDAYAAS